MWKRSKTSRVNARTTRNSAEASPRRRDKRHEPVDVLRREDLPERDEPDDGCAAATGSTRRRQQIHATSTTAARLTSVVRLAIA